jgi:hypothetical protein
MAGIRSVWRTLQDVGPLLDRLEALEAAVKASRTDVALQLATQSTDFLNAYEKLLAIHRKTVKRMSDAAEAVEMPTATDRRFKKAQIRARRLRQVSGGNGVPQT